MKEVKIETCPYCGGTELLECSQDSYGGVYITYKAHKMYRSVRLYALVCRDCGSVIRSYCKKTEKLFPKKERK